VRGPLWWLTGQGGGAVGSLTMGGWGAVAGLSPQADSVGTELLAVLAAYEIGYPYAPVDYFWVRPCLDLGVGAWLDWVHSLEPGQDNFSRWYLAWSMVAAPGVEVMGRLRYSEQPYVGLVVKASYPMPFGGQKFGQPQPPDFRFQGLALQLGLRFGRMEPRTFRM